MPNFIKGNCGDSDCQHCYSMYFTLGKNTGYDLKCSHLPSLPYGNIIGQTPTQREKGPLMGEVKGGAMAYNVAQSAYSEDASAKQKLLELNKGITKAREEVKKRSDFLESMELSLDYIWKDLSKGSFEKLNSAIDRWNKEINGAYIKPFLILRKSEKVQTAYKPDHDLDELDTKYNLLLEDLESIDDPDFIDTVYKDHTSHKLVVDVMHGRYQDAKEILEDLPNHSACQEYIEIVQSKPGRNLMMQLPSNGDTHDNETDDSHHLLLGNGSYIAVINKSVEYLNGLLADTSVKSIREVFHHGEEPEATGTLTCIGRHLDDFYAMTAQHVLDDDNSSLNNKHIISEIQYSCRELHLADLIHLSSSHFGKLGIIRDDQNRKHAVDVALMRISQRRLDKGLLKPIPIFTRSTFEALCPNDRNLEGKLVRKFGAITKDTTGKIINDNCTHKICFGNRGTMFAVVGLEGAFAEEGDSGALVTIDIEGHEGEINQYALGIVSKRKEYMLGNQNVVLCVRLEDCLNALASVEPTIRQSEMQLYRGWLKPAISTTDRREPHQRE